MPVLTLDIDRFRKLSGIEISVDELAEKIPWIGVDLEDVGDKYVKIEYNPNRPDLGSPRGIIKAFKGLYGYETGIINYLVKPYNAEITVDSTVKDIRPYIVGGVVKGLDMDEATLVEIINLQEDLHNGLGRKRRRVSIGIHNLDVISFPVKYLGVGGAYRFVPLNMESEMSINEILSKHPTGVEYKDLVEGFKKFPLLVDADGNVLSFPPIINSEYTRVTESTKNLFIDVTATDLDRAIQVLNILMTTLADYQGKLYSLKIIYPDRVMETPDLSPSIISIDKEELISYAKKMLGIKLDMPSIRTALEKARFAVKEEGGKAKIYIPSYRIDILHLIDIVEEIAIGYGFWNIEPSLPHRYSVGQMSNKSKVLECIAELMIGHGMTEVMNFILTSPEEQFDKMNIKIDKYIEVESPKSREHRILRRWILPQLLKCLYISKKEPYPQRLFEIGYVFEDYDIDSKIHLAVVISHSRAKYSEIKSILDNLFESLKVSLSVRAIEHPSFIRGRVGSIFIDNKEAGLIGEIHPAVLENFGLEQPAVGFELNLSRFIG
jgi:phenylalanyl-tRNA synthetase beta chain